MPLGDSLRYVPAVDAGPLWVWVEATRIFSTAIPQRSAARRLRFVADRAPTPRLSTTTIASTVLPSSSAWACSGSCTPGPVLAEAARHVDGKLRGDVHRGRPARSTGGPSARRGGTAAEGQDQAAAGTRKDHPAGRFSETVSAWLSVAHASGLLDGGGMGGICALLWSNQRPQCNPSAGPERTIAWMPRMADCTGYPRHD